MKRITTIFVALLCAVCLTTAGFAAREYADMAELFAQWDANGYPDDVALVYSVDGSMEKLCVLLTEDTPEREAEIRAMLVSDSGLSFGSGSYSRNELMAVQEEIVQNYMVGGGSPVNGCGVGWTTVDGEVTGFGESGKESRVVVSVLSDSAEEYARLFFELYGGMVVVEAGEGAVLTESGEAYGLRTELAVRRNTLLPLLLICCAAVLAAALYLGRARLRPAMRTADGQVTTGNGPLTRAQTVAAVRDSAQSPCSRARDEIKEKIKAE